jgi:hypothetical protein
MATLPTDDPMILEAIERALEPFKHRLAPAALAIVREEVAALLATQPYPSALLRKLRPLPIVHESGVQPTEGNSASSSAPPVDELARRRGAR